MCYVEKVSGTKDLEMKGGCCVINGSQGKPDSLTETERREEVFWVKSYQAD